MSLCSIVSCLLITPQKTTGHVPKNATNLSKDGSNEVVEVNRGNYNLHLALPNAGGQTERYPRSVLEIPVTNNDHTEL